MATGYTITARQLIDSALRKLGVLIQGESATTTQDTEAILALNILLKQFFTLGMPFYREYTHTITPLVAGTSAYNISPDITSPLGAVYNVYEAFLRNTTTQIDIPLKVISREEYYSLTDKTQQGVPVQVAISHDGLQAYLYLTPDSTTASSSTVLLYGYKQNDTIVDATDVLAMPQEWLRAVVYNLAVDLAPEYGVSIEDKKDVKRDAKEYLDMAVDFVPQENSTYFGVNYYGYAK